jgi:hypothetical protein
MATPEKRWQLLLVADDGRIIPFKHIKGIVLTLLILLVLMGLVCAGLGWQLTREKIKHDQTRGQLASARQEAARYKSENEIVSAELILAEARMEKAGLAVAHRQAPIPAEKTQPETDQTPEKQAEKIPASEQQAPPLKATTPSVESAKSAIPPVMAPEPPLKKTPNLEEPPAVALGDMKLDQTPSTGRMTATFRVSNTGPRSSPAKGWCLVALKSDPADATTWIGLPEGALEDGKLDPRKGKNFKISRFVDVDIDAPLVDKPASFTTATVYIFDEAGAIVMEKDYPISLKSLQPDANVSVGGDAEELGVALSRFEIQQDAPHRSLRATFRLNNTGPRSVPVTGRCVVVLKNEQLTADRWEVLPAGTIVDGKPSQENGQRFKIFRFRDMEIEAAVTTDPSLFSHAVVYVFDMNGAVLLEKAFPIRLAAFAPGPAPSVAPQEGATPATDDATAQPAVDPSLDKRSAPVNAQENRNRF